MIVVTEEMKNAGEDVLWRALGATHTPEDVDRKELAEAVFNAMIALLFREDCPKEHHESSIA